MRNKILAFSQVLLIAGGLGLAPHNASASGNNFMNPFEWFKNMFNTDDHDDDYYRDRYRDRHYRDRYWDGGPGAWGPYGAYGAGPWNAGYPGAPGWQSTAKEPEPHIPE